MQHPSPHYTLTNHTWKTMIPGNIYCPLCGESMPYELCWTLQQITSLNWISNSRMESFNWNTTSCIRNYTVLAKLFDNITFFLL
jgi:hypothetical protein